MYTARSCSFAFSIVIRRFAIVFLMLATMALAFLGESFTSLAHAKAITADSQVIIAVDGTSPFCHIVRTRVNPKTLAVVSTVHTSCAPGSVIETSVVPLSQAQASREAYVLPLPPHASKSQQQQWEGQIQQLIKAKRSKIQKGTATLLSSCSDGNETVQYFGGYVVDFGQYFQPWVQYHVSSDCSTLFLDFAAVTGGYDPPGVGVNWDEFKYSYFRETCHPNVIIAPSHTYYTYPDATEATGLTAVFHFGGAACPGPGPTDPRMYEFVDIGVLD